jgi:FMN phosphatase YigB (HAD superfamily)
MSLLGISDCFKGVFGASYMGVYCKPEPQVFEKLIATLGIEDPSRLCLFEDSYKNLVTARDFGISTVLIESHTATEEGVSEADRALIGCVLSTLSSDTAVAELRRKLPLIFS